MEVLLIWLVGLVGGHVWLWLIGAVLAWVYLLAPIWDRFTARRRSRIL